LPTASSSVLGGVKVGSGLTITDGVLARSSTYDPAAAPGAPSGISVSLQTYKVSWNASPGGVASQYEVQRSSAGTGAWTTIGTVSQLFIDFNTQNFIYFSTNGSDRFRVRGLNADSLPGEWGYQEGATPGGSDSRLDLFLPPAPTSVFPQVSGTTATLLWTQPAATYIPPITDYVVQYSSNSGSTWTTFADGTSTATSATVTGLTSGTAYLFRVAAVNGIGTSSYASATAVQRYSPSSASTNRNTYSGNGPDKAADNDSGSYFQSSDNNQVPVYLTYDLGSAKTVAMYRLLGASGGGYNDPGVWTLQASSDNSTWTTMDSRTVTTLAGGPYTFAVATPASYRYYRLAISALTVGSNVAIASFDVFGA
jgi:hypothetical protein